MDFEFTYTCDDCLKVFQEDRTDEEAIAEASENRFNTAPCEDFVSAPVKNLPVRCLPYYQTNQ